jgi:Tfp pilus assembly protein PilN
VRAVNLIPADDRRGAGGTAGRSGGAAYVLLGALAVLVLLVAAYATTNKSASDKRTKLAQVERDATAAERRAASLQGYSAFATLSQQRVATVASIAASRFDWAHVMHEVARTIPKGVMLTGLKGSVTGPTATAATTAAAAPAPSGPAVTLTGCATGNQRATATMMVSLRQVDGVQNVTLHSSTKPAKSAASTSAAAPAGSPSAIACSGPTFEVVAQFAAPPTPAAATAATTPATTTTASTTTGATP